MGQIALGLLYGIEAPALNNDDDDPLDNLIERFHHAAALPAYPRTIEVHFDEGETELIGIWIAVGGSGEPGVAFFVEEAIPLAQLPTRYAEAIRTAAQVWERFSIYCTAHEQLTLAQPILWITPTEVA
jgi:hypothetical protein